MKNTQAKNEIVKTIQSMAGSYSPHQIFCDWVQISALALQNSCCLIHDKVWEKREQQYIDVIKRYSKEDTNKILKMFTLMGDAMEDNFTDLLGEIYMESGCGNKNTGQFFTPFHLSELCASVVIPYGIDESNKYEINEPSSGGGGMIIAAAKVLHDRGVNYQRCMEVVAQDLDWNGVYMTYTQLSLLGISATVVQGDTLQQPYANGIYPPERVFYTPKRMGLLI